MELQGVFFLGCVGVAAGLFCCGQARSGNSESGGSTASGGAGQSSTGGAASRSAEDLPFALSGQRLRAWFVAVEGVEKSGLFASFHDEQLDTDCEFVPSGANGRFVCMPSARADLVYLDSGCTQPATRVDATRASEPPAWLSTFAEQPAGAPARRIGYRRAEQLFAGGTDALGQPEPRVFIPVGANCQEASLRHALLPSSLYALETVDEATFVAGGSSLRRITSDFSVRRLVAEDGAELTLAVLGSDGAPCETQADGRCVPLPFSVLRQDNGPGYYLDATCSQPAFAPSDEGLQTTPKLGLSRVGGSSRAYELVNAAAFVKQIRFDPSGLPVLDASGHGVYSCEPSQGVSVFAPGREVTSLLPRAGQVDVLTGELHWIQSRAPLAAGANAPFVPFEAGGAFVDSEGLGCRARATTDRDLTCLTEGPEVYEIARFSDPACQEWLYGATAPSDATASQIRSWRRFERTDTNTARLLSFKAYAGGGFERAEVGCIPASPVASPLFEIDHVFELRLSLQAR
jgi:hypothetical protein